jgi:Sec-independent protein secretion pathway component TatC
MGQVQRVVIFYFGYAQQTPFIFPFLNPLEQISSSMWSTNRSDVYTYVQLLIGMTY